MNLNFRLENSELMRNRVSSYFSTVCQEQRLSPFTSGSEWFKESVCILGIVCAPHPFPGGTLMFHEMILFEIAVILVSYLVI